MEKMPFYFLRSRMFLLEDSKRSYMICLHSVFLRFFKSSKWVLLHACQYQTLSISQSNAFCNLRSSRLEVFCSKGVLTNFTKFAGKHLCQSLFFNRVAGHEPATLVKKETLELVFSCELCEISKNTFFYRTPRVAAFVIWMLLKE